MKEKRSMGGLILAAALCAPLAVVSPSAFAGVATSMVASDVKAMSNEELTTRMGKVAEALAGGDARAVRGALGSVSNSGMAVSDEQVKTIIDQLKSHMAKYDAHGALLKQEIFKVENLTIGRMAPNIKGEDTEGVKFELADYHGKVVVIDFWGDW